MIFMKNTFLSALGAALRETFILLRASRFRTVPLFSVFEDQGKRQMRTTGRPAVA
jgi:hypothetical protein